MAQKKLQKESSYNKYDLDGDGADDECYIDSDVVYNNTGFFFLDWDSGCLATTVEYTSYEEVLDISDAGFTEGFFFSDKSTNTFKPLFIKKFLINF